MTYPRTTEENKRYRLNILQKAREDVNLQQLLIEKCRRGHEGLLFWINTFSWTYDPRKDKSNLPFITYPFQDSYLRGLLECIDNEQDNITEKSRDMGFSWMLIALHLWAFRFKSWSSLYGSYKEDYVDKQGDLDSFFERVRYMIERLPSWMMPDDIETKYLNISSKQLNSAISGDTGQNFGTGGRRKFVTLDEFALWQFADKAFRKTRDVTNCRIFGGTADGRWNIFGKIMTKHKDYQHLAIKKFRLFWQDHPLKDQAWYENEKKNRTPLDLAKEVDISYDDSVTGAVYKDFTKISKFGTYRFNPERMLYTSWDYGRDTTAIIWFQKDFENDLIYIIDAYQNIDKDIDFYAAFVNGIPTPNFVYSEKELEMIQLHEKWKHKYANHFGDPYNADSRNVLSENTIKKQLATYGINIYTKTGVELTTVADRINKTQLGLRRLYVDEDLADFIQAINQSRYPQLKENNQNTGEKVKPIHDATSHFRTALEYWFDNEPKRVIKKKKRKPIVNRLTGEITYPPIC